MKLWMTCEAMADVGHSVRENQQAMEVAVNEALSSVASPLPAGIETWAVINIVVPEELAQAFPEVARRSSKKTVLEFRLQTSHQAFLRASEHERRQMLFESLDRSVDLMPQLKISPEHQALLRDVLARARSSSA